MKIRSGLMTLAGVLLLTMSAFTQVNNTATVANAASYRTDGITPDSLPVVFVNPAVQKVLPGTKIEITDSLGKVFDSNTVKLLFVGNSQINFYMPPLVNPGPAKIKIWDGVGNLSEGAFNVMAVAPGIFSANATGIGPAAAVVLRVKANGQQNYESLFRYDDVQQKFVAVPIDLGPEGDRVYLVLFGTGFRNRPSLQSVNVFAGGTALDVIYAGPQGTIAGYDQINALLPRSLAGRGDLTVVVGVATQEANRTNITVK